MEECRERIINAHRGGTHFLTRVSDSAQHCQSKRANLQAGTKTQKLLTFPELMVDPIKGTEGTDMKTFNCCGAHAARNWGWGDNNLAYVALSDSDWN
jgi:hypothetical protein